MTPTIHEATLASGSSGAVLKGAALGFDFAVTRRRNGLDVVVCGDDLQANRKLARATESAGGPATPPQAPHRSAGPHALPHFHQKTRVPAGHAFYETANLLRKARKIP